MTDKQTAAPAPAPATRWFVVLPNGGIHHTSGDTAEQAVDRWEAAQIRYAGMQAPAWINAAAHGYTVREMALTPL